MNEEAIARLIQNRRDMEAAIAERLVADQMDDAAVANMREQAAARDEQGRRDADAVMQRLGGAWPDDLALVEKDAEPAPVEPEDDAPPPVDPTT